MIFHDNSPNKRVLRRSLFGAPQDADITNCRFCGVSWNKFNAKSPLPEGLLFYRRQEVQCREIYSQHVRDSMALTSLVSAWIHLRVSTVSWIGMKPTGSVSFMSISFMSTSTLPKWLWREKKKNIKDELFLRWLLNWIKWLILDIFLMAEFDLLTFSFEKTLVKQR